MQLEQETAVTAEVRWPRRESESPHLLHKASGCLPESASSIRVPATKRAHEQYKNLLEVDIKQHPSSKNDKEAPTVTRATNTQCTQCHTHAHQHAHTHPGKYITSSTYRH